MNALTLAPRAAVQVHVPVKLTYMDLHCGGATSSRAKNMLNQHCLQATLTSLIPPALPPRCMCLRG